MAHLLFPLRRKRTPLSEGPEEPPWGLWLFPKPRIAETRGRIPRSLRGPKSSGPLSPVSPPCVPPLRPQLTFPKLRSNLLRFDKCQALPRRRLVRRRLVSGDGVHVSATFSRPARGRSAKSLTEVHLVLVFPVFLKRRLVAAPLTLTQGALKQPNGGTRAPCH